MLRIAGVPCVGFSDTVGRLRSPSVSSMPTVPSVSPEVPADAGFDHVILTRFSVRIVPDFVFTDEWLAYRWGFFRDGLAASLASQTVRDFTWLVFFDAGSPEWLREEVADLAPGLFTPVWFDEAWVHEPIQRVVDGVSSRDHLITTRVDSDDALSRHFVADVQAHFDHQESLYVNLMCGVQLDRSLQLFHAAFVENGFISYIERRIPGELPRTVFWCMAHEESSSFGPVRNVVGPVRWMQVIHGGNLANSVRGLRAHPRRIAPDFDVDLPFTTRVGPVRFATEWVASLGRLLRLWVRHPNLAVVYWRGQRLRAKGTSTVPQHVHREHRMVVGLRRVWRRLHGRRD